MSASATVPKTVHHYRICRPQLHDAGQNHQHGDDVKYYVVLDGDLAGVYLSEEDALGALELTPGGGMMLSANGWTDSVCLWARKCVFEHDHEDRESLSPRYNLGIRRALRPIELPVAAEGLLWAIQGDNMLFGSRGEAMKYISENGLSLADLRSFPASRVFPSLARE